jgi:hypothetical protein
VERPNTAQWIVLWTAGIWTILALLIAESYVIRAVFGGWVIAALAYWQLSAWGSTGSPEADRPSVSGSDREANIVATKPLNANPLPWFFFAAIVFFLITGFVVDESSDTQGASFLGAYIWYYILFCYALMRIARRVDVQRRWRAWVPIFQLTLLTDIAGVPQGWVIAMFFPLANLVVLAWLWQRVSARLAMSPGWAVLMWLPLLNAPGLAYVAAQGNSYRRMMVQQDSPRLTDPVETTPASTGDSRTTGLSSGDPVDTLIGTEGENHLGSLSSNKETGERDSYIRRHWRGELSLPVAYWVNGIAVTMLLTLVIRVFSVSGDSSLPISALLALSATLWLAVFVTTIWQLTGTWRSAGKHTSRGGANGWAATVRVLILLGVVQTILVAFSQAAPQLIELTKIASGHDPVGQWQIRVLRNASEVEVSGGIGFGLARELQRILDSQPTVKLVHLNSIGGRIGEARRLRDLIAARNLSTYTSTECLSACVIAFIGGHERLIGTGRLGFHSYSFPGLTEESLRPEMIQDRLDFVHRGVDAAFAERAFKPSSEFWYPERTELTAAHVITKVAGLDDVAISGMAQNDGSSIDKLLRAVPLFAALADHDHETYQVILEEYKVAIQRGDSMAEVRRRTLPLAMGVLWKKLPSASDNAILNFTSILLEQLKVLYASDPEKCYAYLVGKDSSNLLADLSPTIEREQEAEVDVINTSASGLWAAPTEAEVAADFSRLFASLTRSFGDDVATLATPSDPNVDRKKYCEMVYALYAGGMELPQPRAAKLLRFLFSE